MEIYNVPKDEGYSVSNNYEPIKQDGANYGGSQAVSVNLPIYQTQQEQPRANRKSRCPRGAALGSIGSCCGMQCTRACAVAD